MSAPESKAATPSEIPPLPPRCGSWVVTSPDGRVFELFDRTNVKRAAADGWRIETAIDYLHRINTEIKAGAQP